MRELFWYLGWAYEGDQGAGLRSAEGARLHRSRMAEEPSFDRRIAPRDVTPSVSETPEHAAWMAAVEAHAAVGRGSMPWSFAAWCRCVSEKGAPGTRRR